MPPLPSSPQTIKVRFIGTNQTTLWNNIVFLQYTGNAPIAGDLNSISVQAGNAWNSSFASLVNTSAALTEVVSQDLASDIGQQGGAVVNHVGTRTGGLMPVNTACVLSWHIARRYRGGHPRIYAPFGVTTDISAGHLWATASQQAFQTGANTFLTQMNAIAIGGSTYFMINVSYHTAHALRPVPARDPILSVSVDDRIDTQRRRLGKPV